MSYSKNPWAVMYLGNWHQTHMSCIPGLLYEACLPLTSISGHGLVKRMSICWNINLQLGVNAHHGLAGTSRTDRVFQQGFLCSDWIQASMRPSADRKQWQQHNQKLMSSSELNR